MIHISPNQGLKAALMADAVISGAAGILQVAAPAFLARHTGLGAGLLLGTGIFLLGYGALLAHLATRTKVRAALIRFIVVGNLMWALACGLLAWEQPRPLPPLGLALLVVQIVATVTFALLEATGLQQSLAVQPSRG